MKTDSLVTIDGKFYCFFLNHICIMILVFLGVVNSISQACGKLSFNIANYLYTQKEGRKKSPI